MSIVLTMPYEPGRNGVPKFTGKSLILDMGGGGIEDKAGVFHPDYLQVVGCHSESDSRFPQYFWREWKAYCFEVEKFLRETYAVNISKAAAMLRSQDQVHFASMTVGQWTSHTLEWRKAFQSGLEINYPWVRVPITLSLEDRVLKKFGRRHSSNGMITAEPAEKWRPEHPGATVLRDELYMGDRKLPHWKTQGVYVGTEALRLAARDLSGDALQIEGLTELEQKLWQLHVKAVGK